MKTLKATVTDDVTAAIKNYAPAHLPVVKAIAVECGIVDTLNELLEWDEQQCNLSPGHRLSMSPTALPSPRKRSIEQQQTVERRLPVLKDPKRVGPVFLEWPDRVKALGYLLLLALLVYSVIERRARRALADADEPMELAGGPTSYRPTDRRVLERFENMRVVEVDGTRALSDNVDVPTRVLDLIDLSIEIYGVGNSELSDDTSAA